VLDVGIGGIHLVQELLDGVDALVVVDAVDLGREPGTVLVIRPEVREPRGRDDLADMHYATPERALMLANALGVLPETVWLVGCQPLDADRLGDGLSEPVAAAVEPALAEIRRLVTT
jgi:hydrogenase maturation protease